MANRTNPNENVKIGRMLQSAREIRKVTQQDMADVVDMSKNHISDVERGQSKASISMLLGYCQKLDMTPNEILGYTDSEVLPELSEVYTLKVPLFALHLLPQTTGGLSLLRSLYTSLSGISYSLNN